MNKANPYSLLVSKLSSLSTSEQAGEHCNVFGAELKNSILTYILDKGEYDELICQIRNIKSGFEEVSAIVSIFPIDFQRFISYFSLPLASLDIHQNNWLKRVDIYVTNLLSSRNIVNVCLHYNPEINSWKSIAELISDNTGLLKKNRFLEEPSAAIENFKTSIPNYSLRAYYLSEVEGYFRIIVQEYLSNLLHLDNENLQPISNIYNADDNILSKIEKEVNPKDYWYKEESEGKTLSIVNLYRDEHICRTRSGLQASVYIDTSRNGKYSDIDLGCKIGAHYYIYLLSELEEYDISLKGFRFPYIDIASVRGREYVTLNYKKRYLLDNPRYINLLGETTLEYRCSREVEFLSMINKETVTYLQLQSQSKYSLIIAGLAAVIALVGVLLTLDTWIKNIIGYLNLQ